MRFRRFRRFKRFKRFRRFNWPLIKPSKPLKPLKLHQLKKCQYLFYLCQNITNDLARNIRKPEISTLERVGQLFMVKTQQVQDRGMDIVRTDLATYG